LTEAKGELNRKTKEYNEYIDKDMTGKIEKIKEEIKK